MGLTSDILKKIKEEIQSDPQAVGYSGKTNSEILALLNSAVKKNRIVEDSFQSPINRILSGIGNLPNTITIIELQAALAAT